MFFKLISCGLLFHVFMSNIYPNKYEEILLKISYYCIYAFTIVEMKVKHLVVEIKNKIKEYPFLLEFIKNEKNSHVDNIEIISDNKTMITCNKDNTNFHQLIPDYCKFIIYSDPEPETNRINKMIIHNTQGIENKSFKYSLCKYMFICVDLYIQNKLKQLSYNLNLFSDGNNYYVVNNRIDKYVICYLLYSRYDVYQNPECCKYKLNIIDHSANIIEISERDMIYLYEDNYEIIEVIGRNHYLDKENISDWENEEGSEESYEKIKKE